MHIHGQLTNLGVMTVRGNRSTEKLNALRGASATSNDVAVTSAGLQGEDRSGEGSDGRQGYYSQSAAGVGVVDDGSFARTFSVVV